MRGDYTSPIPEAFQWRTWAADPEGITGEALLAFVNDDLFPALKNLQMTGQHGDRRRVVRDVFSSRRGDRRASSYQARNLHHRMRGVGSPCS